MLQVKFAIVLVILANKKLNWIILLKVSSIDLILPKVESLDKITYYRLSFFRIIWRSWNSSYNTLKLFVNRASEFNFGIRKNILYLVSFYLENTDASCVRPTQSSNLRKWSHPHICNGKTNKPWFMLT